jgi:hypothetical protein
MTSREDIHRLVDALPAARLPAVEHLLRASLDETASTKRDSRETQIGARSRPTSAGSAAELK